MSATVAVPRGSAGAAITPEEFDKICLAASEARNLIWGFDKTLGRQSFKRVVRAGANEQSLRAAVMATLYAAGLQPPKMGEVGIRR